MRDELKYLIMLSKNFPTIQSAYTEIINLNAILNLPKGTEHFITDLHGAYDAFSHFVKNGSGVISAKIDDVYGNDLSGQDKRRLAILIIYPELMIEKYNNLLNLEEFNNFVRQNLVHLIDICRHVSTKYTKSKVRKALPKEFAYIIEELLYESSKENKQYYYKSIINKMIELDRGVYFIYALSKVIQRLTIDHLHIVGDIFDRGPHPEKIIDSLIGYHKVDIQWGNHDILWMGAASGSELCIANVIRVTARYNYLNVLNDGYGINLLPLVKLAQKYYLKDYNNFYPKSEIQSDDLDLVAKIHKAISIIQFKLEYDVFKRNPEFKLESRLLLDKINYDDYTIKINGVTHKLNSKDFPTINPNKPFELNEEELDVVNKLKIGFMKNEKLNKHTKFLFSNGSMYKIHNGNFLIHGCIPLDADGSLSLLRIDGKNHMGRSLLDKLEEKIKSAYFDNSADHRNDYFVYLWQGFASPLFGKSEMKTFERYFIDDDSTWVEENNSYFNLREEEYILENIFQEFDLDFDKSKIVNGHIPIKTLSGESPIKANGKIYSIDGGLSKPISKKTGIGGYTLRYNSYGLVLVAHQSFSSIKEIIDKENDIISNVTFVEDSTQRQYIKDTDIGMKIKNQIFDLERLVKQYKLGNIIERDYEKS
ncbi:fructose-1,6-bisphosphatase [Mycoplasmatota bacterium]|nr:fructose-1,6-bisphosphatase [Mycoplasmatota bacterium]